MVGAKGQAQTTFTVDRCRLNNVTAPDSAAVNSRTRPHADIPACAVTGDPFRDRPVVGEFGLFVWRAKFSYGLIVSKNTHAAIPIHAIGGATGNE